MAVTAVPCPKKGERIVVLHTKGKKTPADMLAALKAAELPNIFLPSEDSFFEVEGLPLLGTGKLDLRGIKELSLAEFRFEFANFWVSLSDRNLNHSQCKVSSFNLSQFQIGHRQSRIDLDYAVIRRT